MHDYYMNIKVSSILLILILLSLLIKTMQYCFLRVQYFFIPEPYLGTRIVNVFTIGRLRISCEACTNYIRDYGAITKIGIRYKMATSGNQQTTSSRFASLNDEEYQVIVNDKDSEATQ